MNCKSKMLIVTIPGMRLVSEANAHEHWRKRHQRARVQKATVAMFLNAMFARPQFAAPAALVVAITRVSPRTLDSDNAVGSAKHVRDAVALWLGRDDGARGGVDWRVEQRKAKTYGVEIRIEMTVQDGAR